MLNNHEEAHKIVFQGVYPAEPNVMVEFYATNQASDQVLNATNVYNKLTAQGQDYYFTRFHIIGVEMKGAYTLFSASFPSSPTVDGGVCVCVCVCGGGGGGGGGASHPSVCHLQYCK